MRYTRKGGKETLRICILITNANVHIFPIEFDNPWMFNPDPELTVCETKWTFSRFISTKMESTKNFNLAFNQLSPSPFANISRKWIDGWDIRLDLW